jgi:hypothetical protein
MERPAGIIRTLPTTYADSEHLAFQRMERSISRIRNGLKEYSYIALQAIPKYEVLYLYVLINGEIRYRWTIVEYLPGTSAVCWDGTARAPKYWVSVTNPVSPPEPIKMRGFQGFRYTQELW